jgi:hypothetical protein
VDISLCVAASQRTIDSPLGGLLAAFFGSAQETKPAPKTAYYPGPIKAAREPNPVKPTLESIAQGKKIYSYDCA